MATTTEKSNKRKVQYLISMLHRLNEAIDSMESVEWHAAEINDVRHPHFVRLHKQLQSLANTIDKELEGLE